MNNSFNIGLSLSNLSSYFQNKQRNKIELAKLENSLNENLENKIISLEIEIETFNFNLKNLQSAIEVFQIDKNLFEISKGKYKNAEITTEAFLKLKKSYLNTKNSIKSQLYNLELQAIKLQKKTKNESFEDSLFALSNQIQ